MRDTFLPADASVYVAGHQSLAGSAVWRALKARGTTHLISAEPEDLDLRDRDATFDFVGLAEPAVMVIAAAADDAHPIESLSDDLRVQVNLMDAASWFNVRRVLFLGSSRHPAARLAGIEYVQSVRKEYGMRWISAIPTTLYGPGGDVDPTDPRVLPAMIRRLHEAKETGAESLTIEVAGMPRQRFLHVDDLAHAIVRLLEVYDSPRPINVGTAADVTMRELAGTTASVVDWEASCSSTPPRRTTPRANRSTSHA